MPFANWTRAQKLYLQCVSIVADRDDGFIPEPALDRLAEAIETVSDRHFAHRRADPSYPHEFIRDAIDSFADAGSYRSRFTELYASPIFLGAQPSPYSPSVLTGQRRRPTPFESLVETARRLRDRRGFTELLRNGIESAGFVGGSTSYGRFFNVKGALTDAVSGETEPASDLDLLVVVPEEQLPEVPNRLTEWSGSSARDVERMAKRVESFLRFRGQDRDSEYSVFSHKIGMWNTEEAPDPLADEYDFEPRYHASIHLCPPNVFDWIVAFDKHRLGEGTTTERRMLKDFRESESNRNDVQRNFAGRSGRFVIENSQFEDSWVRTSAAFRVANEGCYFPGFFQNLILPLFEIAWDFGDGSVRDKTADFRNKIHERLREERRNRPFEHLQVSLSHTRRDVFAPHVVRRVDHDAERA